MPREGQFSAAVDKAHPTARAYRDDLDRHEVSHVALARATRIVHALAEVFDELGIEFKAGAQRTPDGQFTVMRDGYKVALRLSEKSAAGGAPVPHYNLRRGRPLPAWQARRQKEFISTGQLTILIGGQYGAGLRQARFSDTKTRKLEDLLPSVVREMEMRFLERDQERSEAEREDQEQERRWQQVLADAELRAIEVYRAEVLVQRSRTWRDWQDQMAYADAVAARIRELPPQRREDTEQWLLWVRRHLAESDPGRAGHGLPATPKLTREFLEPHVRGWVGSYREFGA